MDKLEFEKIIDILSTYAVSSMGKNECKNIKPEKTFEKAQYQLELTQSAYECKIKIGCNPIRPFSDILPALKRSSIGACLGIGEIIAVGDVLSACYTAKKHLIGEDIPSHINIIGQNITLYESLQKNIKDNFISTEEIADTASEELFLIRKKIQKCQSKIREKLTALLITFKDSLQDPIITMRNGKYVLPVKSECRGSVKGVLHDQSSSGQTVYIEPMPVVEINNELIGLTLDERSEIEKILYDYSAKIGAISDTLTTNLYTLVSLDILFAKASMAIETKASIPILNLDGEIDLKKARHPLLDKDLCVPIDVIIKKDKKCLLITGPNTGGKTVTLKTIGLFSTMAKCGMFINCDINSKVGFFPNIFVDIGDEQSIEQSLSTFSGHIKKIVNIFENIKSGDLCLLDELGAGTDPIEGAALAIAMVDTIMNKDAKLIATTHYSELKAYAIENVQIENASMEFDTNTLSPTYRIITGMAGKSNAFLICKKLGITQDILENANNRLKNRDKQFENVISSAQDYKRQAQIDKEKIEQLKNENESLNNQIKNTLEKQQQEYKRIISKAKDKARKIVDEAKDEVSLVIKDIRKLKAELESDQERVIQKGKETIKNRQQQVEENETITGKRAKNIKIGDVVSLLGGGDVTVLSLPDSKGNLFVNSGIMKIKVNKSKLLVSTTKKIEKQKTKPIKPIKTDSVKNDVQYEIMLIGKNVDEACLELDKFIDDAYICSIKEIRIVHGKGTGVLRKGVQNFLRKNKHVDSFRIGTFGEGENGVTIATLK